MQHGHGAGVHPQQAAHPPQHRSSAALSSVAVASAAVDDSLRIAVSLNSDWDENN